MTTENTASTDENLYILSIPTATSDGTYYVWYKGVGDENHNDSTPACITMTINKKALTITADSATKVYDTTALTKNSYTNTDLVTGDGIESVTITGTQTAVGNSANVPSSAVIKKGGTATTATATGISPKTDGMEAGNRILLVLGMSFAMAAIVTGIYTGKRRKEEE